MHKKLSSLVLGLIFATATFNCEAAKLTQAQMQEIYKNGSTTSTTSPTGKKVETKVTTKKIIKPNISIGTKTTPKTVTQPEVKTAVIPVPQPKPPVQQHIAIQDKPMVKSEPKPVNQEKPIVIAKQNALNQGPKKEIQKQKPVKVSKAKKQNEKFTKTDSKQTTSTWKVKIAQKNLRILGYSNEPSTGKLNATTKEALIAFQKKYKLTAKGELNDETYNKLNWEAFVKTGIKNIKGSDVVAKAAKYKGVPYVFGGTTPKGFDCSGYVQYVFKQLGGTLTRTADTQAEEGIFVNQKQLKPGDLVFFTTYEPGASHVGIYAGNGQFWNASSSRGVVLYKLGDDYWRTRYYGARRVLVNNGEIN